MKNKTIVKIFTIAVLVVILVSATSVVFADVTDELIKAQAGGATSETGAKVSTAGNTIIGIIQIVGVSVAVIMLIFLGVKYVSAAPGEKADVKKSALVYVIGAAFILAATAILGLVKTITGDIEKLG